MLSFVNSSHPSCSNSSKDIDPSSDVSHDIQAHPSNFSIRKYVFKSRSKDIRSNWPFREQLLQLCIDNGINDILPPLESSSSIMKARYSLKDKTVVVDGVSKDKAIELDSSSTLDSLVVLSSSKEHLKSKCESKVLESNNVSTSMSSKACPVCKTFTSSSNTTLNAHIDQCLSSTKSTMTREEARLILRPKVNAQKKRLMVDIYKTAKICTLEDLDLRNGTNWAATLAVTIPINNVNYANDATNHANDVINLANDVNHGKDANDGIYGKTSNDSAKGMRFGTKRTVPQVDNAREGNVGDIYVDSNGTKLLILSKCNDSSPVISSKHLKMKKHLKDLCTKKMSSQPATTKVLKNTMLRRKINLDKELDPKDVVAKELHSNEAYDEEKEWDEGDNHEPPKLGHWVRSKRSNLSRKHPDKITSNDGSKVSTLTTDKKTANDHTQRTSDNSNIKRRLLLNYSKSFKTAASPKFKAMKVICSTLNELDNRNTSSGSANMISHPSNQENFSSKEGTDLPKTCTDKPVNFFMGKTYKKRRSALRCKNRRVGENDSNIVHNGSNDSTDHLKRDLVHSSVYSKYQEKDVNSVVALNKDMEYSISRDESQVELPIYNDEDTTNNEVVNRDIQTPTDQPKIMERHGVCRTNTYSFRDPNLYVTSDGDTENIQENSSTTSIKTMPNDQDCNLFVELESSFSRVSTTTTISPPSPREDDKFKDYVAREDPNAKVYPKESSCSCSEITNSNQFVKLPSFSSVDSSLESHNETINVSQNQCTPNPILRLMGKDLVVSKQASICDTKEKFISMGTFNDAGFRSYNNNQYQCNPIQAYSHNHQISVHHDQILPFSAQPQYHAQEVINFNNICHGDHMRNFTAVPPQNFQGSNAIMPPQRVFSCYPSQNLYAPEIFTSKQRETTEGTTHVFHSPSSLYFAPVLR